MRRKKVYPPIGRPKVLNKKVLFWYHLYWEKAPGRGFPRFLRKFDFCETNFSQFFFSFRSLEAEKLC